MGDGAAIGFVAGCVGAFALDVHGWTPVLAAFALAPVGALLSHRAQVGDEVASHLKRLGKVALGALLVGHMLAVTAMALPSPPTVAKYRSEWSKPTVRGEVEGWAERLTRWGFETSPDELEQTLRRGATRAIDGRAAMLEPVLPYLKRVGARQGWHMFLAPNRYPSKLQILVREKGTWTLVYEARHPTLDWASRPLDHERFRSPLYRYGWGGRTSSWEGLGDWIARRAAVDFPAATHVQARFKRYRTRSPSEVKAGAGDPGKRRRKLTIPLEPLR